MQNKLELIKTCNTEEVIQKHYTGYGYEVVIRYCIPVDGEEIDVNGNKSVYFSGKSLFSPRLKCIALGENEESFFFDFPDMSITFSSLPLLLKKLEDAKELVKEYCKRREELLNMENL